MYKVWTLLFSLLLSAGLAGCSGEAQTPSAPTEVPGSQQTEPALPAPTGGTQDTAIDWDSLGYSYTTQELPAQVDGHAIYGEIYIPDGAGEAMPAVIFSHGYGGTHSIGAPYAQALAEKGFVVYCYDFRGGSNSSRSDGSPLDMSVFTEKADLEAVLSMLQSLDYVDNERIFLMGTSQGGMVSAMTGAAHPEEIRGMMLLYPAFCIPENARAQFSTLESVPDQVSFFSWLTVGRRYVEDVWEYDVYADAAAYEKNVLILHGDQDGIVDIAYSHRAVEAYPAVELKVIQGAGHGFSGGNFDLAMDYILDYLGDQLS